MSVVADGVVYVAAYGVIYAIDAASGTSLVAECVHFPCSSSAGSWKREEESLR